MSISTELIDNIDLRACPRLDICKGIKVFGDVEGELLNITHLGASFVTHSPELPETFLMKMKLMGRQFSVEAKPIWSFSEATHYRHGVLFLNPSESTWRLITRFLILREFAVVIKGGKSKDRTAIKQFSKEVIKYIAVLASVDSKFKASVNSKNESLAILAKATDSIMLAGEELRGNLSDLKVYKKIKEEFRKIVAPWAYKSRIVKHSYDKPKGYPGDFKTLEVIYDQATISGEDIGLLFDAYFLVNPYAVAVRNRKDILREHLRLFIKKNSGSLRILNLASGSCREIRELLLDSDVINRNLNFFCLDWDEESLRYSQAKLLELHSKSKFNFINENLLTIIKDDSFESKYGKKFDLIYSIGLADYLPNRVIKRLAQRCFNWLNVGGEFIIAHKDKEKIFSHLPPEWFCAWEFIPRNQEEILQLLKDSGVSENITDIHRDLTNDIFFITIKKIK